MIIPKSPKLDYRSATVVTAAILAVCVLVLLVDLDTKRRLLAESEKLKAVIHEARTSHARSDHPCIRCNDHSTNARLETGGPGYPAEVRTERAAPPRKPRARKNNQGIPSANDTMGEGS